MTVHLTEWRFTWNWIQGDLEWFMELTGLHSLDGLEGRCRVAFCSLWLLGSIWTMWLGCLLLSQRLLSPRGFHRLFMLCTFLVTFCLSDGQGWSVQTCQQMPCICHIWLTSYNVPPRGGCQLFWYLRHQGQNDFNPMPAATVEYLKVSPKCNLCRPTMAQVMPSSYRL